jgi:Protein of unknown function (DUF3775)
MLELPAEKLAFIVLKARAFAAKVDPVEPDPGSNPSDDRASAVLEDLPDDATEGELAAALRSLNDDELAAIVALVRLGRGDIALGDWRGALREAREGLDAGTAARLVATPLLGDLIEEGAAAHGISLAAEEARHL